MSSLLTEKAAEKGLNEEQMTKLIALEGYLFNTDYVVIKISEAATQSEAQAIREEYSEVLTRRAECREEINEIMGTE